MKAALHKQYVPNFYQQDLSERVAALTQGTSTVTKYSDTSHTLNSRAKLHEEEDITVGRLKEVFQKVKGISLF